MLVYAGLDQLTGKEIRLTGSARTESEAKAVLRRLRAQVGEQRAPKTKASFRAAMDAWLRVLDVEAGGHVGDLRPGRRMVGVVPGLPG